MRPGHDVAGGRQDGRGLRRRDEGDPRRRDLGRAERDAAAPARPRRGAAADDDDEDRRDGGEDPAPPDRGGSRARIFRAREVGGLDWSVR